MFQGTADILLTLSLCGWSWVVVVVGGVKLNRCVDNTWLISKSVNNPKGGYDLTYHPAKHSKSSAILEMLFENVF